VLVVFTNVTESAGSPSSGLSIGALAGIVLGTIAGAVTLSAVVTLLILRVRMRKNHAIAKRHHCEYLMFLKFGCSGRYVKFFNFACKCFYSTS
jgi:nitrate reductase gamma subunit